MKNSNGSRMILSLAACVLALMLMICGATAETAAAAEQRTGQEIIEELAVYYGTYGDEADGKTAELLDELSAVDPAAGVKWQSIMSLWKKVGTDLEINENILPDGLPETDELCLVVLGFQLNPDGSMKDELVERLKVAKAGAEKYPRALVVCTGGGTAAENPEATEAGEMAKWLIANGVDAKRVIVENQSLTTAQNAIYTWKILTEQYPQVKQLAIISSDYHIATGTLLFGAEATLQAEEAGKEIMAVVSNAAWPAPSGTLSAMFQAGALIELSGDVETAFAIYYDTYDIHELPALDTVTDAEAQQPDAAVEFKFYGKTEASVKKKTVPYITDFGEQYGGRKESKTNICFVDGGDIPYVAVSEYVSLLRDVLLLDDKDVTIDYQVRGPGDNVYGAHSYTVFRPDNESLMVLNTEDNTI